MGISSNSLENGITKSNEWGNAVDMVDPAKYEINWNIFPRETGTKSQIYLKNGNEYGTI